MGEESKHFVTGDPTSSKNIEGASPVESVATSLATGDETADTPTLTIDDLDTEYAIRIPKSFLEQTNSHQLREIIALAISPLFLPLPNERQFLSYGKPKMPKSCAIFMQHMPHYTGGRYSVYLWAVILSQFMDVTLITNDKHPFENDFADYNLTHFTRTIDTRWGQDISVNQFDFVIGVPNLSGQFAMAYSQKFQIPCYLILFESPNFVREHREGEDSTEGYWENYKKCLMRATGVICPSQLSADKAKEWLVGYQGEFHVLHPALNQIVADMALQSVREPVLEGDEIVDGQEDDDLPHLLYVSRMVGFKNPVAVLDAIARKIGKARVTVIGRIGPSPEKTISDHREFWESKGLQVDVLGVKDDRTKFEAIRDCDLLLFPSSFEGFGMPPMEALYFEKPVVCYDLEVLRMTYGDHLNYVPVGDADAFADEVKGLLADPDLRKEIGIAGRKHIMRWATVEACAAKMSALFRLEGGPLELSVGIIAFNAANYLREALDSVYEIASEIIIVEGAIKGMWDQADVDGSSTDATRHLIATYHDPENKITLVLPRPGHKWEDKIEMQNEIAWRVRGDLYLKLDADEIWKPQDLLRAMQMFEDDHELDILKVGFWHFWTSFDLVATGGGQWESKIPRMWRWQEGFHHGVGMSFNYFIDRHEAKVAAPEFKEGVIEERVVYHFGYVQPVGYIRAKIAYMAGRGIERKVEDTYSNWAPGQVTQPCQQNGTAVAFEGELPAVMIGHPYYGVEDVRKL